MELHKQNQKVDLEKETKAEEDENENNFI